MADFGWAFVKGNLVSGSAPPSGAVQYNDGNNKFAASGDLIFVSGATSQLNLTGTLNVSGAINANEYNVTVTNQNVINLSATGSTKFGDSTDDTHVFTGSLNVSAASNPIEVHGLQSGTGIDQDSYIALNSNYQLVLTSAAGAGGEITVKNDGTNLTTDVSSFNFTGSGVTATNSGDDVLVTIEGGGISYSRRAVTSTITSSVNDSILGVSGTSAIDIRLPSAADFDAGQYFTVKDESGAADTKNITILASGSQTIDGRSSILLESPYAAVNIYSDGTSKFFVY